MILHLSTILYCPGCIIPHALTLFVSSMRFVALSVPETKGKTLEEIERFFESISRAEDDEDARPELVQPLLQDA